MGFYNVVKPCVVGKLHYARPTTQPIEVDDDAAALLVESGCLEPYRPGGVEGRTGTALDGVLRTVPEGEDLSGDFVGPVLSDHPEGWAEDAEPTTSGPYATPAPESDAKASNPDAPAESKPRRPRRRDSED